METAGGQEFLLAQKISDLIFTRKKRQLADLRKYYSTDSQPCDLYGPVADKFITLNVLHIC